MQEESGTAQPGVSEGGLNEWRESEQIKWDLSKSTGR